MIGVWVNFGTAADRDPEKNQGKAMMWDWAVTQRAAG